MSAKDQGTGKAQSIKIQSSSGLTEDEVERMRQEAEKFKGEDQAKRELVDLRNNADQLVYSTESLLKEHADSVSGAEKKEIEGALEKLREVKGGEDAAAIRTAIEKLSEVSQEFGKRIYEKAAASGGAAGAGDAPGGDESNSNKEGEPIDADFEVKE